MPGSLQHGFFLLVAIPLCAHALPTDHIEKRSHDTDRVLDPSSTLTILLATLMPLVVLPHLAEPVQGNHILLKWHQRTQRISPYTRSDEAQRHAYIIRLCLWLKHAFSMGTMIRKLPTIIWLACAAAAFPWTKSQQPSSADACTSTSSQLNPDIGGIGVRIAIYLPGTATFFSAIFYHFSPGQSGIKELGLAQLAVLSYLVFNLLKSSSTMQGLDLIAACMSVDVVSAAVFATFSQKETLAARNLVRVCTIVQLAATVAIGRAMAALPLTAENQSQCCVGAQWWGTINSCRPVPPSFWIYFFTRSICGLHAIWLAFHHMQFFNAAEHIDQHAEQTSPSAPLPSHTALSVLKKIAHGLISFEVFFAAGYGHIKKSSYAARPGTVFSNYQEWACIYLMSACCIEHTLSMNRVSNPDAWDQWGQSAQITAATAILIHWCYIRLTQAKAPDCGEQFETDDLRMRIKVFWNGRTFEKSQDDLNQDLILSSKLGDGEGVQRALEADADINTKNDTGQTPLLIASLENHAKVVKLLLSKPCIDANIAYESSGATALHVAAERGYEEITAELLSWRDVQVDLNDSAGHTALSLAARCGRLACLQLILEKRKLGPDIRDAQGRTPLSHAAQRGEIDIVDFLLSEKQASADSRDGLGRTPLSWLAGASQDSFRVERYTAVGEVLLGRNDVNPDSRDDAGRSPLWWAAKTGSMNRVLVEMLLKRPEVHIHAEDKDGLTPLSVLSYGGYTKYLIEKYSKERHLT